MTSMVGVVFLMSVGLISVFYSAGSTGRKLVDSWRIAAGLMPRADPRRHRLFPRRWWPDAAIWRPARASRCGMHDVLGGRLRSKGAIAQDDRRAQGVRARLLGSGRRRMIGQRTKDHAAFNAPMPRCDRTGSNHSRAAASVENSGQASAISPRSFPRARAMRLFTVPGLTPSSCAI